MKIKLKSLVPTQGNQVSLENKRFRTVSPGIGAVLLSGSFLVAVAISLLILMGCGATPAQKANTNFFTSGSREADQRASERMAQSEQLSGAGEGSGEKGVKKAKVAKSDAADVRTAAGLPTSPRKPRKSCPFSSGSVARPASRMWWPTLRPG